MSQACYFCLRHVLTPLCVILCLGLAGCSSTPLPHHVNFSTGYGFDYPVGWQAIDVQAATPGVMGVWRDPIEQTANISVIVNPVSGTTEHLTELGTPTEVGYRFFKEQSAKLKAAQNGLQLEFLGAAADKRVSAMGTETYYTLEYRVTLPAGQVRHNLARAVLHNGQLFTFNLGLPEPFWQRSIPQWRAIAASFEVL